MRILPLTFTHDGFQYTQIARTATLALYAQCRGTRSNSWEVIKVQVRPARRTPSGAVLPAGEYYPSSSQWGDAGWTFKTLAAAQAHMAVLLQAQPVAQQDCTAQTVQAACSCASQITQLLRVHLDADASNATVSD